MTPQESAHAAAHELAQALMQVTAGQAGMRPADIVVIVRGHVAEDGTLVTSWDSFWKPPTDYGGGGGIT